MRVFNRYQKLNNSEISVAGIRRLLLLTVTVLLFHAAGARSVSAQARDIYITPDGGGNGVCTNNTHPPSWFNNSSNWGSGAAQIGPDSIVHLCGTFSGAQNSTMFTVQGSGASGHPVTILFESGANLTSPAWSGSLGAINLAGQSYIVVDGGSNGIIQNTDAGTNRNIHNSGFTSLGINAGNNMAGGCKPGCRITNLTVANMYVHVYTGSGTPDSNPDQTKVNAVTILNADGLRIDHCTFHDMGWAISYPANNIEVDHNNIYNVDHGLAYGANGANQSGAIIHDNHIHDFANWDTGFNCSGCNSYHHDGLHFWNFSSSVSNSNILVYNNLFDGDAGINKNGFVYAEGLNTDFTFFNNIFIAIPGQAQAIEFLWLGENNTGANVRTKIINNTFMGLSPQEACILLKANPQTTYQNNLMMGCNTFLSFQNNSSIAQGDYNVYEAKGAGGNYSYNVGSIQTDALSNWKSSSGQDAHSIYDSAASVNSDGTLHSNSPAIGAGVNLAGLGIAALNSDKNGSARPSSGSWTVGAYGSGTSSASTPPAPPTNVKATVQ